MSHRLLYLWAALMLVRASHRAAVDLTDITEWFRFGDSSRSCGRWCGRAPYPAECA